MTILTMMGMTLVALIAGGVIFGCCVGGMELFWKLGMSHGWGTLTGVVLGMLAAAAINGCFAMWLQRVWPNPL